jgi:ribonucleoside-diphosphate reductase alpha chain
MQPPSIYQQYIYKSRYSRWLPALQRREEWSETVDRYIEFIDRRCEHLGVTMARGLLLEIRDAILTMRVMPSMRAIRTAGKALAEENLCGFNCSYTTIDQPRKFDEVLYLLMNGTGVGFSVERRIVLELPPIPRTIAPTPSEIVVEDTRAGWAMALRQWMLMLWAGLRPRVNASRIRPKGAPLHTMGGRASGPAPLLELFDFIAHRFELRRGGRLRSIDCHDIVCKIASVVVVGGVRRSALISLSDLNDAEMATAKSGDWWKDHGYRSNANNSACYEDMRYGDFLREWAALYEGKSGERGIFNRDATALKCAEIGRIFHDDCGTNPCGEAILPPNALCNLSEIVRRPGESHEDVGHHLLIATILGTIQSSLTDFHHVSPNWRRQAESEPLLGVSMTGIMDLDRQDDPAVLRQWRDLVRRVNEDWAERLGIRPAVACTMIKPSGTVSSLVDSSPGIHARISPYVIRTVREERDGPVALFMRDQGIPYELSVTDPENTAILSFPQKAPNSNSASPLSAIEQLEIQKCYRENYCDHNVSATIYVAEGEWMEVASWVWANRNEIGGVSFLPKDDHVYEQAPYQPITEEEYCQAAAKMPKAIDWSKLAEYEDGDNTVNESGCTSGVCEK